ncbi:MAG: phosphatidylserine decarboxylase [Endomicrobiia bacterium]
MIKEARQFVVLFAFFTVVLWILSLVYNSFLLLSFVIFFCILTLLLVNFFRDPQRKIKKDDSFLFSPADGRIFDIIETKESYCIKIFISIFDVHIQRAPVDCSIKDISYKPGKFLPAGKIFSGNFNEKNIIELETKDKDKLIITQIAGILARRIVCWVKKGGFVSQGDKIGAILLGSQVNFEFPKDKYMILVKNKQKVFAGITVVAVKNKFLQ